MDLSPAFLARTRRRVRSIPEAVLLARVTIVMGLLPLFARLSTMTMLRWLERLGRLVNIGPRPDAGAVVAMVRSCGGLRRWSFQDNCVSQSLTLFTLLNRADAPLDVLFGIEQRPGRDGLEFGRRHVWLERDGEPVFEREPLLPYVVQVRYRGGVDAPTGGLTIAGVVAALGVSGTAAALTTAASLVRTKVVAMVLGPAGMALSGQVSQATLGLGWLATFGASAGATRYLAEAIARDDEAAAATVVTSSGMLIAVVASGACLAGVVFAPSLSLALFGSAAAVPMVRWLLPSLPAIAIMSLSASMLRGTRQVGRLSAAQGAGAIAAIVAAPVVLRADAPASIPQLASLVFTIQACAVSAAAWPLWKRWLTRRGDGVSLTVVRAVAGYGASNVATGLATAAALVFIGRSYLAAGAATHAGHIAALAWFGEPVAAMLAAGLYASAFPAYCAGTSDSDRVLSSSIRGLVIVAAPVLTVAALLGPVLMPLLFNAQFSAVAPLLPLQLLATYGRAVSILLGIPLLARGRVALLTILHLGWAAAVAAGSTAGLAGPQAYAVTWAAVTWAYVLVLGGVLAALGLSPSRRDYAWVLGAGMPLLLTAAF